MLLFVLTSIVIGLCFDILLRTEKLKVQNKLLKEGKELEEKYKELSDFVREELNQIESQQKIIKRQTSFKTQSLLEEVKEEFDTIFSDKNHTDRFLQSSSITLLNSTKRYYEHKANLINPKTTDSNEMDKLLVCGDILQIINEEIEKRSIKANTNTDTNIHTYHASSVIEIINKLIK